MWLSLAWGWVKNNCSLKTLYPMLLTFLRPFTAFDLHCRAGEKKVPSIFSRQDNREASFSLPYSFLVISSNFFPTYQAISVTGRGWPWTLWSDGMPRQLCSTESGILYLWETSDVQTILQGRTYGPAVRGGQQRTSRTEVLPGQPQLPRAVYFSIIKDMLKKKKKRHAHYWLFGKHAPQRLLKFCQE